MKEHVMETLEMPVVEESAAERRWSDAPPVKFEEQEMDIAAFRLWRTASSLDLPPVEEP
jgi:hypothetical protein